MSRRRPPPPASRDTLLAGRYRLLEERSTRGPAMLWHGQDDVLARPVAIHLLRLDDPAAAALLDAAAAAGRVSGPGLTQVFDAAEQDGYAYVVREWAPGENLGRLLGRGPLPPDRALQVGQAVAEAVRAAHDAGLAHLRLHPGNVIVAEESVKLTDLGTAAALAGLTAVSSPVTARADARGLGAVLYAGLTARWPDDELPSEGLPPAPRARGRICSPRQVRAAVPKPLDTVAMRALDAGPPTERRPAPLRTPAAVARALAATPAGPPGAGPRRFSATQHVWLRRGAALSGLLAIAVGAWMTGLALGRVPGDGTDDFPTEGTVRSSAAPARPVTTLVIPQGAVSDFDPQGDRKENPDQVPLAYDGDPSTTWETSVYRGRPDFGGLKDGVGLRVDFGRPTAVSTVLFRLLEEGADIDLRVTNTAPDDPSSYRTVGSVVKAQRTSSIQVQGGPVSGRYWLVWITRLPRSGGGYATGIAEMRFSS